MKSKLKSTSCLVFKRIWEWEKLISLLFLISYIIILATSWGLGQKGGKCGCVETCLASIFNKSSLIYTLAVSYVSGVMVYFLTVILPESKRKSIYACRY